MTGVCRDDDISAGSFCVQKYIVKFTKEKNLTNETAKVIESGEGEDYRFDTEILERGNLNDL